MKTLLFRLSLIVTAFVLTSASMGVPKRCIQPKDTIRKILEEIARHNIYESRTVGYSNTISTQYLRYEKLTLITTEELISIATSNRNAVVRLYAFQALKAKKIQIPTHLINIFRKDQSEIQTLKGCIGRIVKMSILANETLYSEVERSVNITNITID